MATPLPERQTPPASFVVRVSAADPVPSFALPNDNEDTSANDAVRFDLALDELNAIRPTRAGAHARMIEPIQVDRAVREMPAAAVDRNPRDLAIRDIFGDRILKRPAKRDEVVQRPATDRLPAELDTAIETTVADKTPRRGRRR